MAQGTVIHQITTTWEDGMWSVVADVTINGTRREVATQAWSLYDVVPMIHEAVALLQPTHIRP